MLSDEEKNDILFQIDMQLYDEFNDKFCEINDNLGIVYSYNDLYDLEKAEREKEIKLLREAIEKQSKEIEELKQIKSKLDEKNIPIETLLAELDRLEDIEDRKVQIEYNNVFNKGVKSVEDKIKAKIEELKKLNDEATSNCYGYGIHFLQSLLEKE